MSAREKAIAVGIGLALTVMGLASILEVFYDAPPPQIQEGR